MGTPAGPAFHFTVTQYIQEGVFLLTPVPQNFQFLKGKDMFPTLKMNVCCQQYLLPEKQLSHVKTPPWKPRGTWSLLPEEVPPAHQDPAATGIDQRACFYIQENE